MLTILPIYAALLALVFVGLSIHTIRLRRAHRVSVGDGGHDDLFRATRIHANFAEYVPLCLLLLALLEGRGAPAWALHTLGSLLLLSRIAHAVGLRTPQAPGRYRVLGMVGTFGVLIVCAVWLLVSG